MLGIILQHDLKFETQFDKILEFFVWLEKWINLESRINFAKSLGRQEFNYGLLLYLSFWYQFPSFRCRFVSNLTSLPL